MEVVNYINTGKTKNIFAPEQGHENNQSSYSSNSIHPSHLKSTRLIQPHSHHLLFSSDKIRGTTFDCQLLESRIALEKADGSIIVTNPSDITPELTIKSVVGEDFADTIKWSPCGTYLAISYNGYFDGIAEYYGKVSIYNALTAKLEKELHTGYATGFAWSNDSKFLAISSFYAEGNIETERIFTIWHVPTGSAVYKEKIYDEATVGWLSNKNTAVIIQGDDITLIKDTFEKETLRFEVGNYQQVVGLSCTDTVVNSKNNLVYRLTLKSVLVHEAITGRLITNFRHGVGQIISWSVDDYGEVILIWGDEHFYIWSIPNNCLLWKEQCHLSYNATFKWCPSLTAVIVSDSVKGINIWFFDSSRTRILQQGHSMQFLKLGERYINPANILTVSVTEFTIQIYFETTVIVISNTDEIEALKSWLEQNSLDVLHGYYENLRRSDSANLTEKQDDDTDYGSIEM